VLSICEMILTALGAMRAFDPVIARSRGRNLECRLEHRREVAAHYDPSCLLGGVAAVMVMAATVGMWSRRWSRAGTGADGGTWNRRGSWGRKGRL
jgi:hypothetical protein